MNLQEIQGELRAEKLDGWLFYDHHRRDPIAARILGCGDGMNTRRWFYLIPARGEPRKLVHRIESAALDHLPGKKVVYSSREELEAGLKKTLGAAKIVAMQYSPRNEIFYVSLVDAGTVELVRGLKCRVVTSADLVQKFEASWTPEQLESHRAAGRIVDEITQGAFRRAAEHVREGRALTEYDLVQWMLGEFRAKGLETDDGPNASIGPSSGDPHYEPRAGTSRPIRAGELLLLDVWAKFARPDSVYYDITWMGYLGPEVPERFSKIFGVAREARDAAVEFVRNNVRAGRSIAGFEVDRVARGVIRKAGYARNFIHRTGHNIGRDVHGSGANMDDLEIHDVRRVLPHTCFSIEPGIYFPEFGVRTEVNVYVDEHDAGTTGAVQQEILPLLA
ncbi:MAG TPA: M24 family metallopeptidase [Candidatus Acidoferrales bacterium]|nr:M24 family metallopeptidase [Candidatus Acidoferrales bacterium]